MCEDLAVAGAPNAMLQLLGAPDANPEASGLATCVCLYLVRHPSSLRVLEKGGLPAMLSSLLAGRGGAEGGCKPARAWPPWVYSAAEKLSRAIAGGGRVEEGLPAAAVSRRALPSRTLSSLSRARLYGGGAPAGARPSFRFPLAA